MAARRLTSGGRAPMQRRHESVVERLAAEAIRLGADFLDVEYKEATRRSLPHRAAWATALPGSGVRARRR